MKKRKKKIIKTRRRMSDKELIDIVKAGKPSVPKPHEAIDALHKLLDAKRQALGSMLDGVNTFENQVFELKLQIKNVQDHIEQYETAIIKLQEN